MSKTYALNLAKDGRILSVTLSKYAPEDAPRVDELPDGNLYEYRFTGEDFIHDPLPVVLPETVPTIEERMERMEKAFSGVQAVLKKYGLNID